jgi:glycosyltransferase involved in cell wall biosynthesis
VPVYDEPEDARRLALGSVVANRPSELIAVVDGGDLAVARVAAEYCDRVLRIAKAEKRAAIAAGLRASDPETDVVVVLDSDTIWAPDARLQRGPAPGTTRSNALVPVRIAALATMFHQGWITRPDRPDLSAVRSSLLPDEAAPEIFMAMQGDHAS